MKCKYCSNELKTINKDTYYCLTCQKGFQLLSRSKKPLKHDYHLNHKNNPSTNPKEFKKVCSSANYNREPVLNGGLVRPR